MTGISCHPDIEYAQIPGFRPLELDPYLPDPAPPVLLRSADFAHSLAPLEV